MTSGETANVLQHMITVQSELEFQIRAQKRNSPQQKQIQFLMHKANDCENTGRKSLAQPTDQQKKKKKS